MEISAIREEAAIPGLPADTQAETLSFWPFLQIAELANRRYSPAFLAIVSAFAVGAAVAVHAQTAAPHPSFEVLTPRMDVDVDGAPNAYGPPGKPTLDVLINAHYLERADQEIVGYLMDDKRRPILQGPKDPFPGYYISQTAFTDVANHNQRDPRGYVDARNINYVVRGNDARRRGVKVGDFVAVYSATPFTTGKVTPSRGPRSSSASTTTPTRSISSSLPRPHWMKPLQSSASAWTSLMFAHRIAVDNPLNIHGTIY